MALSWLKNSVYTAGAKWHGHVKGLWQKCEGMVALEFAIISPVFIALIMAMVEAGLLMTRITLVDHALARTAKYIYLGPAAGVTVSRSVLEDYFCDQIGNFLTNCSNNIVLELTPITAFDSPPDSEAPCIDSDVEIEPLVTFNPGGSNSIVYLRACMTVPIATPGMGLGFSLPKTDGDKYQIISNIAFVNEPY